MKESCGYGDKWPSGKLGIGISALASASALVSAWAFEYKFSLLHSINRPQSQKFYIFLLKTLLLNKVATYTLGTGAAFFNKIAEINSRPLVEKGLHQRGLPMNILELSALPQEGLT